MVLTVGAVAVGGYALYKMLPALLKPRAVSAAGGYMGSGPGAAFGYPQQPQQQPTPPTGGRPTMQFSSGNPQTGQAGTHKPTATSPTAGAFGFMTDFLNSIKEGFDASGNGGNVYDYANGELGGESLNSYNDNLGEYSSLGNWDFGAPQSLETLDMSGINSSIFGDSGTDPSGGYSSSYDGGGGYSDYSGYGAGDYGGYAGGYSDYGGGYDMSGGGGGDAGYEYNYSDGNDYFTA